MAMRQEIIDRYKTEGFFKHVQWNSQRGVFIQVFDKHPSDLSQTISFEAGVFDAEYDQYLPGVHQFFLSRAAAVKFMINLGMAVGEIASTFRLIDNEAVVTKHIYRG
jgi:hypothetical protein